MVGSVYQSGVTVHQQGLARFSRDTDALKLSGSFQSEGKVSNCIQRC